MKLFFKANGQPDYRANQVYDWIYRKLARDFGEMNNLPRGLREELSKISDLGSVQIEKSLRDDRSKTCKFLLRLDDGQAIECVIMGYRFGFSCCVSSQVGCPMGCRFCASAIGGFQRNLRPWEMVEQVLVSNRWLASQMPGPKGRVSRVVLMGTGEPLLNYDNVLKFIKIINEPDGLNIGLRRITISTCGVVPGIRRLAGEGMPVNLSVSLHAPNDKVRSYLMPINDRYPIKELLKACHAYAEGTSRRVTFEYSLIRGVNDSDGDARELASLLKGMLCHVNLIPLNPVKSKPFEVPPRNKVEQFVQVLCRHGVQVTVRRTIGKDINAACGQLRHSFRGEGNDL